MKKILIFSILITSIFTACKKDIDHPPLNELNEKNIVSIQALIEMYQGTAITITDTLSVFGTVTMDEVDGNIYKNIYIQANGSAINVRMTSSGRFYVGDSVRINVTGAKLDKYNGVMQIDGIDPEINIVKQASGKFIAPKLVKIGDIDTNLVNQLIMLEDVQFSIGDLSFTYADGPNQQSRNVTLEDCFGRSILLRSSGFANFSREPVATGKGSIVVIVDRYNDDLQLKIRSFKEVKLNNDRCEGLILPEGETVTKNFNDNSVTSGGWSSQSVIGSDTWEVSTVGSSPTPYLKIQNYNSSTSTNIACENWFISPKIKFEGTNPKMIFENDVNYSGPVLQLLVSTDYSGIGNPNDATWIDISASVTWDPDTGGWGFSSTGDIDLSAFAGQAISIAFKYQGSNSDGSTWEIDEILITG